MIWDNKAYDDTLTSYAKGRKWLGTLSVEIEGGEASVDPLFLLRAYEAKPSVDNSQMLASAFCKGKRVVIRDKAGTTVHSFVYTEGDISEHFETCPWLLDTLHQAAYAILVKKLTPPSKDSEVEERTSE